MKDWADATLLEYATWLSRHRGWTVEQDVVVTVGTVVMDMVRKRITVHPSAREYTIRQNADAVLPPNGKR